MCCWRREWPHRVTDSQQTWHHHCRNCSKCVGHRYQHNQIPWRRMLRLAQKGKWSSGCSQIKHHSTRRRRGMLQLQVLTGKFCQRSIVTFLLQPATGWNRCQHISRNPGSREWAGWVSRSCQQAWIWLCSCNWWQQLRAFDALIRACRVILALSWIAQVDTLN